MQNEDSNIFATRNTDSKSQKSNNIESNKIDSTNKDSINTESTPNLRARLRELDLKIIELSELLDISRPTLYKHIECYEASELDKLPPHIISLFNYLQNPYINKHNVLSYIVDNIIRVKGAKSDVKERFKAMIDSTNAFNEVLEYLLICNQILQAPHIADSDKERLAPLENLYKSLQKISF